MKEIIPKFKFKDKAIVINAPTILEKEFLKLKFTNTIDKKIKSSNTVVFVNSLKEFTDFLIKQLRYIEPDSVLWFAYAKGTSGIKTDINRDILWQNALQFGIQPVTAISIDETWSALRFRPIDKIKKK